MRRRMLPLLAIAIISFAAGLAVGSGPPASVVTVKEYASAWARQDFAAMYELLNEASAESVEPADFEDRYRAAYRDSTAKTIAVGEAGEPRDAGGATFVPIPVTVAAVAFGTVEAPIEFRYRDGGIEFSDALVFPGMADGEVLAGSILLPERGSIVTIDGEVLAEGPAEARVHPLGDAALDVTGFVGEPDEVQRAQLQFLNLPSDILVGTSGLEKAYDSELMGDPGGTLYAVSAEGERREIASAAPVQADPLVTTIESGVQTAAVDALGGRPGGIAVLDARNGAIRALAGLAYSTPQPPGSTYKVVTTVAALETGATTLEDEFPVVTGISVDGRFIRNAGGQYCGGTLIEAFARSCNSAFLPMGADLGAETVVEFAERFGFNSPPPIFNDTGEELMDLPPSTIPTDMSGTEEIAVTSIGQGRLLATPLQMASVAQTIAARGVRRPTRIVRDRELGPPEGPVRVTTPAVARQVGRMMVEVVEDGTGYAAALDGIAVAGKTGTAELGPKPDQGDLGPDDEPEQMLNAWFIAYAPAERPRYAISVMLIDADADGGVVAAPLAGQVLAAALYE